VYKVLVRVPGSTVVLVRHVLCRARAPLEFGRTLTFQLPTNEDGDGTTLTTTNTSARQIRAYVRRSREAKTL
jgi:hypothetical protein